MDQSAKDNMYFIDEYVYNCPFCRRRNIRYTVERAMTYTQLDDTEMHVYQVECTECRNLSLHFSQHDLQIYSSRPSRFIYDDAVMLDAYFVAHRPGIAHVLDPDIPKKLRDLLAESDESRQSNLLTGASAALRKTVYQLLSNEKTLVKRPSNGLTDYKSSILALKTKYSRVDGELFDQLASTTELTSDLVHEDSWPNWSVKQLRFLTGIVVELLEEIYAEPARRKRRKETLAALKANMASDKKAL